MGVWTQERVQYLEEAWEAGQTAAEIAQALGLSPNAVGGKIYRLGLPKRRRRRRMRVVRAAPLPIPQSLRVSLLGLGPQMCRWPEDEPEGAVIEGLYLFCGHRCAAGYSYCPAHALVAYRAEEKLVRRIDIQLAAAA